MSWDWDYLLHWLGGAAIQTICLASGATSLGVLQGLGVGLVVVALLAAFGISREAMQHVRREGPWNRHIWIEALTWPLGGLCGLSWLAMY